MSIEGKIKGLLKELNFKEIIIKNTTVYTTSEMYLKVNFLLNLKSYVLEYADNYEDAEKNLFEDGDLLPISKGENELINEMRDEILKNLIQRTLN